jgi:deaminated glutathione amidase
MSEQFLAACLQLTPSNDLDAGLEEIGNLVSQAAGEGAKLVALPEFATYLDRDSRSMRSSATAEHDSVALSALRIMAADHGVWMLIGSLVILPTGDANEHLANRSFLISPNGEIAARYDKIHLFDAQLADGRVVGESKHYRGGTEAVVVETALGRIGLSICYDLRFPALYRSLALAGAEILTIPAAFTLETGRAHWEPLLRARAIETGCYVLAPATVGKHPGNWDTYGHASIIDPWGTVLASCSDNLSTYCIAAIEVDRSRDIRARLPSLTTNPSFTQTLSTYPSNDIQG